MSEIQKKPFSKGYVLRTTSRNIQKSIDLSIQKTFERVAEFSDDTARSQEVFQTLSELHELRRLFDNFRAANPQMFKG